MTSFLLTLACGAVFGFGVGLQIGGWAKARKLAEWVDEERRERRWADRLARQAEGRERAAKQRVGEMVRQERLSRMFGEQEA
jgi:hypothetical protein